ncbi:MAG: hypothetical protein HQK83_11850 [Fibrobacteria bacterium]|nr:hypothetical protein [Fibrobacteria bacterium]
MSEKITEFKYKFVFEDKTEKDFSFSLKTPSLEFIKVPQAEYPFWTKLDHEQCEGCPLTIDQHPYCPIAISITDIIEFFQQSMSYNEVDVTLTTENRDYHKHTSLQKGISSMLGIIMVTCGCPAMNALRPLVFVHLPFATMEETMYRSISMYLLAQFFLMKKGEKPDWELKDLAQNYEGIRLVNQGFAKRLRSIQIQDASLNAVANLDCFAMNASFSIEEGCLDEIEELFEVYLKTKSP